jgi:glycolate oxidase
MPILKDLQNIIPKTRIIHDKNLLKDYQNDKSANIGELPKLVVFPKTEKEIKDILFLVNKYKYPIVMRGAGTGCSGGAVTDKNSIVLCLTKMNKILEFDEINKILVVESGVITEEIHKYVENKGLYYPPDPASSNICTIGGNVAENAGGPRARKYGVTQDYVVGLEGFYINGDKFKCGGKLYKNVAGYNLIQLLVGSEGTLAIITKIYLKLRILPKYSIDLQVSFPEYEMALESLTAIHESRINVAVAEFFDQFCLEAAGQYLKVKISKEYQAHVIFQVDGYKLSILEDQIKTINKICLLNGAGNIAIARTDKQKNKIWHIRKSISESLRSISHKKISQDIVVPLHMIKPYLLTIRKIGLKIGLKILGYGHLGDGNIHVNILKLDSNLKDWEKQSQLAIKQVFETAVKMGGTITGEHGIGLSKKDYMHLIFSKNEIDIFHHIKNAFDPENLLNPGKIL